MRVLFAPLGLSYGSLYSAIVLTKPDKVIVVTSQEAATNVPIVVGAAKQFHPEFEVEVHTIADAFTAFAQGRSLARRLAQKAGDANIVCLTGGTTALQDSIKCVADLTGAKEIALVDRRPIEEQRATPFVISELVEIPPLDEA